jgi:hypothetical protein
MLLGLGGGLVGPSNPASAAPVGCSPRQSSYSSAISSTPGLVGYWRLGESSGTVACDSTTHNNGAYVGGFTLGAPGAIAADPDTALTLDGSSGQVGVPAASSLNVGDTFTIEAWVKRGALNTGHNEVIASKQEGAWVLMFNESNQLTLRRSNVANIATATVATTDTTNWHYVVATKNGSSVHLYLDGTDVTGTVSNQTIANNTQPLAIGQSAGGAFLKGSVDEVALYNTPLTPTQITQHYQTGVNPPSTAPVLAAVGDIACPYGDTTDACQQQATANLVASQHPNAVAVLGDNQYQSGLLSEFNGFGAYNATWGQFNPIVRPVPGNHEYAASSTASGYFTYFGAAAGNGYGSYELGSWHIITLNSNCSNSGCQDSVAGTSSSAEVSWLKGDLAAHPNQCILADWHHPLFSSGWVGNSPGVAPFWNALYAAHADVVLNGHDHMYERYGQQDPAQNPTTQGIREFVVGTGGESLFEMGTIQPNMQAVDNHHFGVLFLTLHPGSYEWTYRATNGTVLDSGSTPCHLGSAGGSSALIRPAASAARFSSTHAPSSAVQSAAAFAATASTHLPRLTFAVHLLPASLRSIQRRGLPLQVRCSRACDVSIAVRVSNGRHMIAIASYRETETEIPRRSSRVDLHLSQGLLRHLRAARLTLTFVAVDASEEHRSVTRTLMLMRHPARQSHP